MPEHSDASLNLFFPQWQGSGRFELYEGAQLLYKSLRDRLPLTPIATSTTYSLTVDRGVLGHSQILAQLADACSVIQSHKPDRIVTIGGDCGVEIAPVSFLNQRHEQNLAIVWLDAHGDLNTPTTSPSSHFHGMPLRVLLGEGDRSIVSRAFSVLHPHQVFLVGTREFDRPERDFTQKKKLPVFSAQTVNNEKYNQLIERIRNAGFSKIYIHLDLDVIEPEEFPHVACPTPGGIHIDSLASLLLSLQNNFRLVGFSLLEFLPNKPKEAARLNVVKLLEATGLLPLTNRLIQMKSDRLKVKFHHSYDE